MTLVADWRADLAAHLRPAPCPLADLRVGVYFTAARLASGEVGLAWTPRDPAEIACCPRSAASAPPAGRIAGMDAWEVAGWADDRLALKRAIAVATLNALSAFAAGRQRLPGARLLAGLDALAAAGIAPPDRVTLCGAFPPFLKALKGRVARLRVLDSHPESLKADERDLWCPSVDAAAALADTDVVLLTGSTLVEGGLDALLDAASGARRVVIAGPSAPLWPGPFFARGVDVLAGLRVRDGDAVLRIVGEAGSAWFFADAVEKICLVREQ